MSSTESIDPRYIDIDSWPTVDAVTAMLDGQVQAVAAVRPCIAAIAAAAEAAAERLSSGTGRLVYVGAGTSGRIAVQDGVELGPTFGWRAERLAFLMAGGMAALATSAEGAEDDDAQARILITEHNVGVHDVVIGVAASGRTPFTIGALIAARSAGALTIAIANNSETRLLDVADHALLAATGSEVLAGSTRMQAGTAQKIILNLFSTATMVRLGHVYRGLMVDMVISNVKLLHRAQGIVQRLTSCSDDMAVYAVEAAGHNIKGAVLIALGLSPDAATAHLAHYDDLLRPAIAGLPVAGPTP